MKKIMTLFAAILVSMITIGCANGIVGSRIPKETEAYTMCWGATVPETVQTFWTTKNFLEDDNPKLELIKVYSNKFVEADKDVRDKVLYTLDRPAEIRQKYHQYFFKLTDDTFLIVHLNMSGSYMKAATYRVL